MKEIKDLAAFWNSEKQNVINRCTRYGFYEIARKFSDCTMMNGDEKFDELCDLLFTPQANEILIANKFPSLSQFRDFTKMNPERFGIYIDSDAKFTEPQTYTNQEKCAFVGNTTATVKFNLTKVCKVIAVYGANVTVIADGFSVINITRDAESQVDIQKFGHAKVLINKLK